MKRDDVILVRGGGDLATGTIHRLWSAGLKVLVLEAEHPAAIRRQVSVSEAVYEGGAVVEGMRAALVKTLDEAVVVWRRGDVPVMVDPKGELIPQVRRSSARFWLIVFETISTLLRFSIGVLQLFPLIHSVL